MYFPVSHNAPIPPSPSVPGRNLRQTSSFVYRMVTEPAYVISPNWNRHVRPAEWERQNSGQAAIWELRAMANTGLTPPELEHAGRDEHRGSGPYLGPDLDLQGENVFSSLIHSIRDTFFAPKLSP